MADSKGRPKLCGNCGKLMGTGVECPYCGADNSKVRVRLKRAAGKAQGASFSATLVFVGLNAFFFILAMAIGGSQKASMSLELMGTDPMVILELGAKHNPLIDKGQWWRFVMPVFLHYGLIHVALNTWWLWSLGPKMERDLGPWFFTLIYLASGIGGVVASYWLNPMAPSAGASGAVSGMIGAVIARRWMLDGHLRDPITRWAIQVVIMIAVFGLVVDQIDNAGHGGGFLTGAAVAWLITKYELTSAGRRALFWGAGVLSAVTVAALAMMTLTLLSGNTLRAQDDARKCANSALGAIATPVSIDPEQASVALSCFADTPKAPGDFAAPYEGMRQALIAAQKAKRAGALSDEKAAVMALDRHFMAYKRLFEGQ